MIGERKIAGFLAICGIATVIGTAIAIPSSPKSKGELEIGAEEKLKLPVIKSQWEQFMELTEKARQEKEARIAEEQKKKEEQQKAITSSQSRGGQPNSVIYTPYDIGIVSGITSSKLNALLSNTGLSGLADVYIQAEREYGVNALFLVGLTALESGWGKSHYATAYNNLAGNYTNGSITKYSSKSESVYATARLISKHYLNPNGNYYNGKSIWNINVKYCESKDWADKINSIVKGSLIK